MMEQDHVLEVPRSWASIYVLGRNAQEANFLAFRVGEAGGGGGGGRSLEEHTVI